VIAKKPYFQGHLGIPNRAHLILVPLTMLRQWESELKVFFQPKTIEIYVYPIKEEEQKEFWTGRWSASQMPLVARIVLVSHSVSIM
jgi:TATA-binding protein-associated factor